MNDRLRPLFVAVLILCLSAGPCAAFDLQLGRMHAAPPPAGAFVPDRFDCTAVGVRISIPFGGAGADRSAATLNGRNVTAFTRQNAKDAAISIMLIGTAVALGVVSVMALGSSFSND